MYASESDFLSSDDDEDCGCHSNTTSMVASMLNEPIPQEKSKEKGKKPQPTLSSATAEDKKVASNAGIQMRRVQNALDCVGFVARGNDSNTSQNLRHTPTDELLCKTTSYLLKQLRCEVPETKKDEASATASKPAACSKKPAGKPNKALKKYCGELEAEIQLSYTLFGKDAAAAVVFSRMQAERIASQNRHIATVALEQAGYEIKRAALNQAREVDQINRDLRNHFAALHAKYEAAQDAMAQNVGVDVLKETLKSIEKKYNDERIACSKMKCNTIRC